MLRLGLRLTVSGGRDALVRLAIIAAAVAIGVGLLVTAISGINATNAQNGRYAWLETGFASDSYAPPVAVAGDDQPSDPLWWSLRRDTFDGEDIGRVDVAATGPRSPVPPGFDAVPGPGQLYASPAMAELLRTTPADQLGDRYGATLVGTIGPAGLATPGILLVVVGHRVDELADGPYATLVDNISTASPSECGGDCGAGFGINAEGISLILGVVGAALLFPVLICIGSATRLSAARREQRFAAMRLVGATPRQVAVLSAVESAAAATVGTVAGFGVFWLLRPAVATIPFTGARFYTSDLSLGLLQAALVAVGVPVAATVAARLALRRVQISPLGVTRRATPPRPQAWRVLPLLAGVAELSWFAVVGRPDTSQGQMAAYLPGILLIMAGLVIAGPWLTMAGARLMARRTGRPAVLIAGRRLSDNPQAGFRAISGLILALFVGSGAVATITTVVGSARTPGPDGAMVVQRSFHPEPLALGVLDPVAAIPGVVGVTVIYTAPKTSAVTNQGPPPGLVSCAELARTPSLGRCPPGAEVVAIEPQIGHSVIAGASSQADAVWPVADLPVEALAALPVDMVLVDNDGSTAVIEQVRTALQMALPQRFGPETVDEANLHGTRELGQYQQLANVVIASSLAIAGCSLAVSVAAGLSERKRPFSLLRLTGVPLAMLRRIVVLETVVPLLVTAVVAAGSGFLAAQLFVRAQMDRTLQLPGPSYYLVVLAGLVVSLAVISSTFPLLDRITGPEATRND